MAPDPNEINRKIQEEINKLTGQTKRNWQDIYDTLRNSGASLDQMQDLLESVEDLVDKIRGSLDYTASAFRNIVKEIQIGNKALQFQETLISRANTVARQTLEIRKGDTFASASKIQSLQRESQLNLDQLKSLRDSGKLQGDQLTLIDEQISGLETVIKELEDIDDNNKKINKGFIGTVPALAKMFSNVGIVGNSLTEAYQTTVQLGQGALAAGVEFNTMGTFTQAFGSQLKEALGPMALLIMLVEQLKDAFLVADTSTGDLAKDFNITYDAAAGVRQELIEIGNLSGDAALTSKKLQESTVAIGKALGSNAILNEKDLVFMTKMREQAGFTNDELVEMQKYTLATGGNLEENTKNLMFAAKTTALNNGVLLNEKDIMRDIAKTSDAVKLSIAGGATALGRAAAQAKVFGMNLDQLNNIAGGLMDFESSISAELEAQLLTGKDINLEQARLYALNNDMEGLSKEIAKNYGSVEQFSKMNRLQQEATAKAVGMSREELAKTLTDAEALKGISGDQAKNAQAALNAARARGMSEEEIAQTGVDNLMKQQDLQQRFNQSVEKLKEIFVSIAEPILKIVSPLADLVSTVLPAINLLLSPLVEGFNLISQAVGAFVGGLKEGNPLALTLAGTMALIASRSIIAAISGIWLALSKIPLGVGLALVGTATAGFISMLAKGKTAMPVGDMYSPPDGKTQVSTKEGGLFELSKNDTLIAGPIRDRSNNQQGRGNEVGENLAVRELQEIKSILKRTYDLEKSSKSTISGTDELSTDKRGTKANVNTYKLQ